MVFNPVGAKISFLGGIGCSVFDVEVMFEAAIVVKAHIITIMTGETVFIIRFYKDMRLKCAIVKREMAGCTAGAVGNRRIKISRIIGMASKTSASK